MPRQRPIASARISTARTCSRAVLRKGSTYTGWLNRTLAGLAPDGRVDPNGGKAFAVGPVAPLVVRGPAPVMSWSSPRILPAGDDTIMRLLDLYRHKDAKLARVLEGRMSLATIARDGGRGTRTEIGKPKMPMPV